MSRPLVLQGSIRLAPTFIHFVAGLVIIVGTAMPWFTEGGRITGVEYGEGKLILVLGVLALALAVGRARTQGPAKQLALSLLQCEVAAFVIILAVHKLEDLRDLLNYSPVSVGNGYILPPVSLDQGLYVTLAGGSLLALAALAGVGRDLWLLMSGWRNPQLHSSSPNKA
jgi:hypothetical protein